MLDLLSSESWRARNRELDAESVDNVRVVAVFALATIRERPGRRKPFLNLFPPSHYTARHLSFTPATMKQTDASCSFQDRARHHDLAMFASDMTNQVSPD